MHGTMSKARPPGVRTSRRPLTHLSDCTGRQAMANPTFRTHVITSQHPQIRPGQLSFDDLIGHYSDDIPTAPGHYVYRFWGADGTCLYVGCTGRDRPRRLSERFEGHRHERGRPWLSKMAYRDFATFTSAADALAEEKRQIAELQPVYNKRGRENTRRCVVL